MIVAVALPEEWKKDWYEWMERDEREEQQLAEENTAKLYLEIERLDKKLNLLLDSFLDQVIDSETYKQKKNEIFEQKLTLQKNI